MIIDIETGTGFSAKNLQYFTRVSLSMPPLSPVLWLLSAEYDAFMYM
ncbi:MAG: hypothetical protein J7M01_03160 [Candidatus Marinimicrobia bacterium]|nr:hypothetical protein [Candidatus Neomarinimicrobiota bacterium]